MLGSSGGKMIINFGKWPCDVCGKEVHASSVKCTVCTKLIDKRWCSDLSLVVDSDH